MSHCIEIYENASVEELFKSSKTCGSVVGELINISSALKPLLT